MQGQVGGFRPAAERETAPSRYRSRDRTGQKAKPQLPAAPDAHWRDQSLHQARQPATPARTGPSFPPCITCPNLRALVLDLSSVNDLGQRLTGFPGPALTASGVTSRTSGLLFN
jgi:hypothetical protein